ncbi:MAG: HD domain-containing protein [Lachnospiraceae bacterium]|nr:HD domain-containing protein [Lachnospiraceae bacterium]
MKTIQELREGDNVSQVFLCKNKQALRTRAGKTYYSLQLQDKTGQLDGKIWDLSSGIDYFDSMDYIHVEGQIVVFQNAPQLNVYRVRMAQSGEYDPADFVPTTEKNIADMKVLLGKYVASVKDVYLNQLLQKFFGNEAFLETFAAHSAAKSVHHSFMGGLLEHTLNVTRNADYMARYYPFLKRDLLITAALLHDVGKTRELSRMPENDYTDEGNMLGHIYMGAEMIHDQVITIEGFPKLLEEELKHCILAHHGELEFGSPKKPELAEALALHMADNMDAKLETFYEIMRNAEPNETWMGYQKLFEAPIRRTT